MAEELAIQSSVSEADKSGPRLDGERVRPTPSVSAEDEPSGEKAKLVQGLSSLTALIDAYKGKEDSPEQWKRTRKDFEKENGEILDSYFTSQLRAGAVLVRRKARSRLPWRERRRLLVRLDKRDIISSVPQLETVIWRTIWTARRTEREADYVLTHRTRKVFADMLHQVVVYLLGTIDGLCANVSSLDSMSKVADDALKRAAKAAMAELSELEKYMERSAIRAAIRLYLLGLPLGIALLGAIVFLAHRFDVPSADIRMYGITTVVAGGIGSMASVMFRLTRGQRLSVDIQQGPLVTVFAGMFRPLIGAVFGAALYVLVRGGLFPLEVPSDFPYHFYAGLAFIAGFSERWAQDTIIRSAPITPSPAASANQTEDANLNDKSPGEDPDQDIR